MINLTTLPYPMFSTTPEEKEILRKCEVYYANKYYIDKYSDYIRWVGLCATIEWVSPDDSNINKQTLLEKIHKSLGDSWYLHSYLSKITDYDFTTFSSCEVKNDLRLIWITKLLAYEGE